MALSVRNCFINILLMTLICVTEPCFADGPPPPPPGGPHGGSGNQPPGGGAPIGDDTSILIGLAIGYSILRSRRWKIGSDSECNSC
jgi:hypothetical protein